MYDVDMEPLDSLSPDELRTELCATVLEFDTLAGIIERQREVIVFQDVKIRTLEVQNYELICAALERQAAIKQLLERAEECEKEGKA